jgi:hypothetical protein
MIPFRFSFPPLFLSTFFCKKIQASQPASQAPDDVIDVDANVQLCSSFTGPMAQRQG